MPEYKTIIAPTSIKPISKAKADLAAKIKDLAEMWRHENPCRDKTIAKWLKGIERYAVKHLDVEPLVTFYNSGFQDMEEGKNLVDIIKPYGLNTSLNGKRSLRSVIKSIPYVSTKKNGPEVESICIFTSEGDDIIDEIYLD